MKEGSISPASVNKLYPNLSIDDEGNESFDSQNSPSKLEDKKDKKENTPNPATPEKSKIPASSYSKWGFLIIAIVVAVVAIAAISWVTPLKNTPKQAINCSQFMNLRERFNNQDENLFVSLQTGIEGMYLRKPQVPSVFTLFSTDETAMDSILSEIIKVAKSCINSEDPLNLTISNIEESDFIDHYKKELKTRKIMIIQNVDLMPSTKVELLHSFTDTYNPVVSESIIYLTVKVPEQPKEKPVEYIYRYLQESWKDMVSNKRDPLITRFLDQTFYINSGS